MRYLFLLPLLLGYSVPAIAESKTYIINVSAEDYRNYILNGTDRNGSVSGNDPTVTVNKGDTFIFNIDASRHPFYVKTKFSRGRGNQVIAGKLSGLQEVNLKNYHGIQQACQRENIIMFVLHMQLLAWEDLLLLNKNETLTFN